MTQLKTPPYIYDQDPPGTNPIENRRLGYRNPRSILLPPYLLGKNQYFVQYTDGMDQMLGSMVDPYIDIMANIRNMWVTNPPMEQKILQGNEMIDFHDWSQPEREILVKQVNMLGMKLATANILSNDAYHKISRFVGQYWFEKGTYAFMEFINFCLATDFQITVLWTQDYRNFFPEGSSAIGTPIWKGGTWYPTTHVMITAKGGLEGVDFNTLVNFFYEISNYNLVLWSIDSEFDLQAIDRFETGHKTADILAAALTYNNSVVMSNIGSYGIDGPLQWSVAPQLPTQIYAPQSATSDTLYLLGAPSAWIQDADGDLLPVYGETDQSLITDDGTLPTTLMGKATGLQPSTNMKDYILLGGPVGWSYVPGSTKSKARLPVYAQQPSPALNLDYIKTKVLGSRKYILLCNPYGFKPAPMGGGFVPYWKPQIL